MRCEATPIEHQILFKSFSRLIIKYRIRASFFYFIQTSINFDMGYYFDEVIVPPLCMCVFWILDMRKWEKGQTQKFTAQSNAWRREMVDSM